MKFPMYDVSEFVWNNYKNKEHNVLYENPYFGIIPGSRKDFAERIAKFKFVDPDGLLYKVIGFKLLPKKGLENFLLFTKKIELELAPIDEHYSIEMFKELIAKRARDTQNKKLEDLAKKATTFRDILQQIPPS